MKSLPTQSQTLTQQLQGIRPKKKSYFKEIMLVAVLLVLIGVLTITILFRQTILGWFGG